MAYDPYKELGIDPAAPKIYDPYASLGVKRPDQNEGFAGDIGTSVKRGFLGLPGVVTGVADIGPALAFGMRPFTKGAEALGEVTGIQPGKWKEEAAAEYSPGYKQAQQEIQGVWDDPNTGALDVAKAYVKNPSYVGNVIAESAPSMLAGGLAARGLMAAGTGVGALETALGRQTAAAVAGGAGEGLVTAGSLMDSSTGEDQRLNAAMALGTGAITGGLGYAGGKLAQKVGLETVETAMAKGAIEGAEGGINKFGRPGRIVGGAVGEGLLQEAPQSAQEQAAQNIAEGKPLTEGVGRAAVEGALAGAAMGGGVNAISPSTKVEPPPPEVEDAQAKMLEAVTNIKGAEVVGGMATIPVGDERITVPVDKLAEHLSKGGTIDDVDTAAMTADTLSMLQRAVQDERNPLTFENLVDLRNDPAALQEAGVNRKDIDALVEAEIERAEDPAAAWIKQERLARQANLENKARIQGITSRVENAERNRMMDEQVRQYEETGLQVPETPTLIEQRRRAAIEGVETPEGAGMPVTEQESVLARTEPTQEQIWAERHADLVDTFGYSDGVTADRPAVQTQEKSAPVTDPIFRLTELEQKAQGVPGATTSTSLTPLEEQEYTTLRAQASPADQQRVQEYEANVARRDELLRKQNGTPAFEAASEAGPAPITPEVAPQTLTPKEQTELTRLTEATARPPVSPYTDDSRPLAAGLPAAQSDTLFSQGKAPWETGEVQPAEAVASVAQQVNPQVKYDGAVADLHGFTLTLPDGRQPSFSVKGEVTPETFHAALNEVETRYKVPLTPAPQAANAQAITATLDQEFGKGAVARLTRQGKLQIVASATEVPDGDKLSTAQRQAAQGVYKTKQGKIYLVAGNLSKDNVSGVFKHEVVHALLRQDAAFMQRRGELIADFEKLIGNDASVDAAVAQVPQATQGSVKTEEALAYWVQNEANHKHSLFRRMVAVVKAALRRLGIPVTSMTTADFSRLFAQGTEVFVSQESSPQMAGSGGTLYSQEEIIKYAKAFYSKLRRVATSKFTGMKAQSVEPFLLKQGVKKAEIEATGLREWLAGMKPTDKVTKDQLSEFAQMNTVEFEDVVLGGKLGDKLTNQESRDMRDKITALGFFGFEHYPAARQAILRNADWAEQFGVSEDQELVRIGTKYRDIQLGKLNTLTHFDTYTEPGAVDGSYREMFVTAPLSTSYIESRLKAVEQKRDEFMRNASSREMKERFNNDLKARLAFVQDERAKFDEERKSLLESLASATKNIWRDGHSQYSEIKNPIVRIRFNEVTGPNGERILRIEEMQGPSPENQTKMPKHLKDNIYQTGVKRILAYAKENGFDGVALVTKPGRTAGETQADRYDLSKQISAVGYTKRGELFNVAVWDNNERRVWSNQSATKEIVAENLGKDIANKMIAGEGRSENGTTYLEDLDLKVGGEGLKQLYDTDLPNIFKAWGGGKMGEVEVGPITKEHRKISLDEATAGQTVATGKQVEAVSKNTMPYIPITDRTAGEFPLFSQATTAHQRARSTTVANLKEMANEKITEMSPFFLRVSPLRTLVQTLGKQIPQIARISNAFDEMSHTSTAMSEDALGNYKANQKVNKKATGNMDAFSKAATLASFYRMTPWKNLDEQEWIPASAGKSRGDKLAAAEVLWKSEGMDKATGKTFIAAWNEAAAAYRGLKTDEAKQQYQKMARHMQHIRKREETNVLAAIERGTVGKPILRAAMMERFNDTFRSIKGVYWPLTRWGEYTLEFMDLDGVKVRMQFPSIGGRRAFINDMVADGVDPKTVKTGYLAKTPKGQVAIPNELMTQFSQAIVAERTKGLDPEQDADAFQAAAQEAQSTIDDLNQIFLRWQPETSALKSSLRRKNIKGYDLDAGRGYLEYVQRHAQKIAWTEQGRVIEDELKGLNDELRESRQKGENTDLKSMVLQDLRARVQAARDTHVGPIASLLGKLGTAYYMTSPSIALVQMTQLPMLTLPKLGVMYKSPVKAAAALTKAIKDSFSKKFSREALYADTEVNELHNASRLIVTDEMRQTLGETDRTLGSRVYTGEEIAASFAKLEPDQQKLFILRESLARNLLDISAVHEAYAIAGGKNPDAKWRKAFDLAMMPMRISEQASRKAAILATMDMAQKAGKGYEAIMADVHEVVHDTLYSYDKTNKPAFLQGSTGRVLAMFQWYRIMTIFRMALLFKRSIKAESPEIRKAAQKEFIGIMGMAGVLAGTMGMPMAGLIFAALDAGADDDEPKDSALEWRKMLQEGFGERWGNIAAYGLPAAVGMHLTKRIGMGDMFGMQASPPPNMHGKDLAAWWAASQLGPAFSIGQSWVQGYDEAVNKGDAMRGLETAMPKPIKDAMKAYRVWSEGEMRTAGGKRVLGPDQITPDMVPMLALGFNPLEAAKASENRYSLAKLGAAMSKRRGQLINRAAEALEGDGDFDQARDRIVAFNQANPRFRIESGEIRTALKRNRKNELGIPSKREQGLSMQYGIPPVE